MKHKLPITFYHNLKLLECTELTLLALIFVTLPYSWIVSTRLLALLVLNTVVKAIVMRRLGNPLLTKWSKTGLWLLVVFYLYQVLTMLYTSNKEAGWLLLLHRLPLLLFPLVFLVSDTSYINSARRRHLLWLFIGALLVKFIYCLINTLVAGKPLFSGGFDYVHHTYMAMYILMALGFVYTEFLRVDKDGSAVPRIWHLILVAALLTAYLVLVLSRTGIVGVAVLLVLVTVHQIFYLKNVRRGIVLFFVALAVGAGVYLVMPKNMHRVSQTLTELGEGDTSDARYFIMGSSLKAIGESMPFGVGIGDRGDVLAQVYEDSGNEKAISRQYNSHNIYLDILLSTGIPGFLLLLALLVLPTVWAWKRRDAIVLSFLFTIAFCGLFEATLNRQMGIMYMGLFWLFTLWPKNSERGQVA